MFPIFNFLGNLRFLESILDFLIFFFILYIIRRLEWKGGSYHTQFFKNYIFQFILPHKIIIKRQSMVFIHIRCYLIKNIIGNNWWERVIKIFNISCCNCWFVCFAFLRHKTRLQWWSVFLSCFSTHSSVNTSVFRTMLLHAEGVILFSSISLCPLQEYFSGWQSKIVCSSRSLHPFSV